MEVAPSPGIACSSGRPDFFHMKPRASHITVSQTSSDFSAAASASFEG